MFFVQEYNLLFPTPRRMQFLIFIIYFFKTNIFFLVNSSNLMDTIKTIIVLIELQFNSTIDSKQTCLDHAEKQNMILILHTRDVRNELLIVLYLEILLFYLVSVAEETEKTGFLTAHVCLSIRCSIM